MPEDPTLVGHRTLTAESAATFGALTGDYSRIHFDHELGKATPQGRGFAHGLLSASWALGALTLHAPERLGCGDARAHLAGFAVRYQRPVVFGDTLALRCGEPDTAPEGGPAARSTGFTLVDQRGEVATSGTAEVQVVAAGSPLEASPTAVSEPLWRAAPARAPHGLDVFTAEDVLERGPRGASRVRTLTEADVVGYANFSGELNPLYLDQSFAERALFGARTAPPLLCFCLGFAVWLRELLRLPMGGSESSAGHLGDRWRFVAPVHLGDTLEVRYRPLSLRRTRSDPTRGVATFGLQLVNQHESVVQQGEVDMLLMMRADESGRSGRP